MKQFFIHSIVVRYMSKAALKERTEEAKAGIREAWSRAVEKLKSKAPKLGGRAVLCARLGASSASSLFPDAR